MLQSAIVPWWGEAAEVGWCRNASPLLRAQVVRARLRGCAVRAYHARGLVRSMYTCTNRKVKGKKRSRRWCWPRCRWNRRSRVAVRPAAAAAWCTASWSRAPRRRRTVPEPWRRSARRSGRRLSSAATWGVRPGCGQPHGASPARVRGLPGQVGKRLARPVTAPLQCSGRAAAGPRKPIVADGGSPRFSPTGIYPEPPPSTPRRGSAPLRAAAQDRFLNVWRQRGCVA
jgi:hypothetical protein